MMRTLRIGYISHQFPPETGAGAARISEMGRLWARRGAEVTVFTGMPNRPQGRVHEGYRRRLRFDEEWDDLQVRRSWVYASPKHGFARTLVNNLSFMVGAGLRATAAAGDLDVLIASAPPFFVLPAGGAAQALRRVPTVVELRDLWPDYLVSMGVLRQNSAMARLLFAAERRMLLRADHVIVVTESFKERVVEKGVPADRISVIPNGVEMDRYYPADEEPPLPALRAGGELVVGYLGNFGSGQALTTVVDAAALLRHSTPRLRFVLAGDGTQRAKVLDHAKRLGLDNVMVESAIPKDRTRAFYNACDLCLVPLAPVPAFQDTVPSKLFEILACGKPVVASVAGEAARIVERSRAGWVTEPGNADALAAMIQHAAGLTAQERQVVGGRGRGFVSEHYERGALAMNYLSILDAFVPESTT